MDLGGLPGRNIPAQSTRHAGLNRYEQGSFYSFSSNNQYWCQFQDNGDCSHPVQRKMALCPDRAQKMKQK